MSKIKFELVFTNKANEQLEALEIAADKKAVLKTVNKTLGLMESNLRHPSLNTHKYSQLKGSNGEDVFESYVQNNTPGEYRIFWHYGPSRGKITILTITAHP